MAKITQATKESSKKADVILQREDDQGLVHLTLNRPGQFYVLSEELLTALKKELDRIAVDQSCRVVVIGGNGKAFSAGHDLKQMHSNPSENYCQGNCSSNVTA